ncbi:MAG: 3',5'-cyclic-nucleotide phosphodiesterase [Elusimicrobia bacterium]|nr:MAG: 3',5'-cyclic-nucleotide phosphodiesterase [Elusimicrobiota bacterium]
MRIKVLGCSGGIGGRQRRTTALLVDDDILVDAGTGAADLPLAELARINHVFLTHSHLDHIASLPLLVDSASELRRQPLTVYATAETLEVIGTHIFNWVIWPDFRVIPDAEHALMRWRPLASGETVHLGARTITALPAEHTVPAVGYQVASLGASLVFTGDTTVNEAFWPVVNGIANLRYLLIETAFPNHEHELAMRSKHLCPSMLASELTKLTTSNVEVYVSHLKPGQSKLTMAEIKRCTGAFRPRMLQRNQVFEL